MALRYDEVMLDYATAIPYSIRKNIFDDPKVVVFFDYLCMLWREVTKIASIVSELLAM